jgi:AcrR family transcriptional regulator
MPKKPGLTREKVLEAAVALVDARGLGALSMRRLGEALGVEAMSLYRYVSGKEDLLDGVHEVVVRRMHLAPASGDWRERLGALARAFREVLLAHPNAVPLFATRPAVAPGSLAHADAALGLLREAGFQPRDELAALHALIGYVVGMIMAEAAWPGPGQSRVDYAELPAGEFPNLRRLAPEIEREDAAYEFEVGLEALLDGLAARLRR